MAEGTVAIENPSDPGSGVDSIATSVLVQTSVRAQGRTTVKDTDAILRFYTSLMGDAPYTAASVVLLESEVPGGHSPGYFAVINVPTSLAAVNWRGDPASFDDFPEFFLAHELAHQWWGQAIGWKNYHEQWISEGFAQYFATLYAREKRGDQGFRSALRNLRRWSLEHSDQGPISLGYRLGHIKNEGRVFRALVYNKGAAVLHMLRRLVGDEAFFSGLRRFYAAHRYRKAGTDDLRRAMEAASGRDLTRFFERWVLDSTLPRVRFTTAVKGDAVEVSYEQAGEVFDVPVTVTLSYADGTSDDHVVSMTDASGAVTLKARGPVRSVDVNRDDAALGYFDRR
jgi:aminopeptidase N